MNASIVIKWGLLTKMFECALYLLGSSTDVCGGSDFTLGESDSEIIIDGLLQFNKLIHVS